MITIIFYGLDQFVVGQLSKDLSKNIAKLYEVSEDEVNFIAPNDLTFHNGVEQTSWDLLMHVHAPKRTALVQEEVAKYLLEAIGDVAIHKTVEFYYYEETNRYTKINEDYPRYITEDNVVKTDAEYDEELEEGLNRICIYILLQFHCNLKSD